VIKSRVGHQSYTHFPLREQILSVTTQILHIAVRGRGVHPSVRHHHMTQRLFLIIALSVPSLDVPRAEEWTG